MRAGRCLHHYGGFHSHCVCLMNGAHYCPQREVHRVTLRVLLALAVAVTTAPPTLQKHTQHTMFTASSNIIIRLHRFKVSHRLKVIIIITHFNHSSYINNNSSSFTTTNSNNNSSSSNNNNSSYGQAGPDTLRYVSLLKNNTLNYGIVNRQANSNLTAYTVFPV